jgi:hypothetical protein
MKASVHLKSYEVRALLEAKRNEINLLLPTVAPSVGIARVEQDAENNYVLQVGETVLVKQFFLADQGYWYSQGPDGPNLLCNSLNDAIIRALPEEVRPDFGRKLHDA